MMMALSFPKRMFPLPWSWLAEAFAAWLILECCELLRITVYVQAPL